MKTSQIALGTALNAVIQHWPCLMELGCLPGTLLEALFGDQHYGFNFDKINCLACNHTGFDNNISKLSALATVQCNLGGTLLEALFGGQHYGHTYCIIIQDSTTT